MFDVAIEILNKIASLNKEAYIIGGFSRDYYLGIINEDIDICTNASVGDLESLFENIELKDFGSMIITYKNYKYDITRYRAESTYKNNRFPSKIEYITSLDEDLKRRDFVINTLCIDKNRNYVDKLGARIDLDNKIIRSVGDPYKKIEEDALRILRAIRFATSLDFELENNLKDAIIKYGYLLDNLSLKRKQSEIDKILKNEKGLRLLKELNLDNYLGGIIND